MSYSNPEALVSTEWLAQHMSAPDVRLVDASWFLPGNDRDPKAEYAECHIPGAVFFDIDEISDTDSDLPHMLPSPEKFSSRVRKLGLGDGVRIVVYDSSGFAAHRVWWTFRVFGHEDVAVLDGGLRKWVDEGRPTDDMPTLPRERHFTPRQNNFLVRSRKQMIANLASKRCQVIDARPTGRFTGEDAEIRPGLKSGHIPGSVSIPMGKVVDMENNGVLRSADMLKAVFEGAGMDLSKSITTTCGSGVSASTLTFALYLLGNDDVAVYDGSWSEWGGHDDCPVETGA